MTPALGPIEAQRILEVAVVPALRLESAITRQVLAAIPSARADFRTEAGARSAVDLARHIVSAELRFLCGVAAGTFADLCVAADRITDLADLVSVYETESAAARDRLVVLTGDDLVRVLDYRGVVPPCLPVAGGWSGRRPRQSRGELDADSSSLRSTNERLFPVEGLFPCLKESADDQ